MAIFSRVKNWVSNEVLTASDLNGEFNNLLTNTKPESIEDYSTDVATMRLTTDPGGSGTESQATSLAGEIERLRFAIKRIVGGAQWYTAPVIDLGSTISASDIASDAVTTAKILDSSVTTAKINDAAVTLAKLVAANHGSSASCGTFSGTATSFTDITNLSVTFAVTGRPIVIELFPAAGDQESFAQATSTLGNSPVSQVRLMRDAVVLTKGNLSMDAEGATGFMSIVIPSSALIRHYETPAAGTYVWKLQYLCDSVTTFNLNHAILVVRELL